MNASGLWQSATGLFDAGLRQARHAFGYDAVDSGEGKRRAPSGVTRSEDDELPVQKRRKLFSQTRYANGFANTVRPMGRNDPSGRSLTCDYGASGGISGHASRIALRLRIGGRPPATGRGLRAEQKGNFGVGSLAGSRHSTLDSQLPSDLPGA